MLSLGLLEQLTGDRRLSDALAEFDARGWNALPLAQKELSRLFPELWETTKAAERWVARNPLIPLMNIIRVWGVLNTYRPLALCCTDQQPGEVSPPRPLFM